MIAGVTGHQDLGYGTTQRWIASSLREIVRYQSVNFGLTSLAAGADQLFAEVLLEQAIPFGAILPCRSYERAFQDEAASERYNQLVEHASSVTVLDFEEPTEEAFYAAGKEIVMHSDILFAVWNGKGARGFGGTADIVKFALAQKKPILQFDIVALAIKRLPTEK